MQLFGSFSSHGSVIFFSEEDAGFFLLELNQLRVIYSVKATTPSHKDFAKS